jgi:large subunit ribosomal protein L25
MSTLELKAAKRHITGKKVHELRSQSITPAHLFGPKVESETIQCETLAMKRILIEAGHTKLISLHIGREKTPRTVMVREVQINSISGELLHVDLYQVQMTENIRVNVPIVLIGESAAAKGKGNTLVQELNELIVLALPANIPSSIEVDISPLATENDLIRVRDIQVSKDVTIINDAGVVIARIAVEVAEVEPEKPKAAEEAVAATEETPTDEKKGTPDKAEKKE